MTLLQVEPWVNEPYQNIREAKKLKKMMRKRKLQKMTQCIVALSVIGALACLMGIEVTLHPLVNGVACLVSMLIFVISYRLGKLL